MIKLPFELYTNYYDIHANRNYEYNMWYISSLRIKTQIMIHSTSINQSTNRVISLYQQIF